ncbi:hypothetical protein D3C84_850490 [compost metagenome]
MQRPAGTDDDRQARQKHPRCGLAQGCLRQAACQLRQAHVATVDEDRHGHLLLAHHPFLEAVLAADELIERVLLEHRLDQGTAGGLVGNLRGDCLGGIAGQVGHFRFLDQQRFSRSLADAVARYQEVTCRTGTCRLHQQHCGEHQSYLDDTVHKSHSSKRQPVVINVPLPAMASARAATGS